MPLIESNSSELLQVSQQPSRAYLTNTIEEPSPASAPFAEKARSVNPKRRKSVVACDQFLRDDKAIRLARAALVKGETSVSKGYETSPLTLSPHPITPNAYQLKLDDRTIAGTKKPKPLSFSRVNDRVRARFAYLALNTLGPVHLVHINLGDEILKEARRQPDFLDWISRRIKRDLEVALGRRVDLYLVLEELCDDGSIRPHLHGAMQISTKEAPIARKVIRKAAGEWTHVRQHQVKTQEEHDFDSATYATKQAWKATPGMRTFLERMGAGRRYVLSFKGKVFTATKAVHQIAAELYAAAVEDVLTARRGELTIVLPSPLVAAPTRPSGLLLLAILLTVAPVVHQPARSVAPIRELVARTAHLPTGPPDSGDKSVLTYGTIG